MRTIKVHILTAEKTDKVITVKDIIETSVVNGVLEVWAKRKDEKNYETRQIVAGFAKDYWTYFEEV